MAKTIPDGQKTDEENSSKSDPNLVGPQATEAVRDDRAGKMTTTLQYDEKTPYAGRFK